MNKNNKNICNAGESSRFLLDTDFPDALADEM
jgi:hypothetical protein